MSNKRNRGSGRSNNFRGRSTPYVTRSSTNSGNQNVDRKAVLEDAYDNHKKVRPDPSSLDEEDMKQTTNSATKQKLLQPVLTETIIIKVLPKLPHVIKKTRAKVPIKKNLLKKTILMMQNLCSLADT